MPGTVGSYLRVAFYRFVLQRCDPTATIAFGVLLSRVDAEIHRHVYIGPRCMLGSVTLEEDVLLGPAVQIPSGPNLHGIRQYRHQALRASLHTCGKSCQIAPHALRM